MQETSAKSCCVCGRVLPNKYAVAGTCAVDGCSAAFCSLHWHSGNHLCPAHGGETVPSRIPVSAECAAAAVATPVAPAPAEREGPAHPSGPSALARFGNGVAALAKKLAGIRNPQEQIDACSAALDASRARRDTLRARYDALFLEIAGKKKTWQAAPAARKRILELELRTLLSEYQGLERQLEALYENERTLVAVRARVEEVSTLESRKIGEREIDRLVDSVEDAVTDADATADSLRDLEKAGARRFRDSDADSFEDTLAAFDAEPAAPTLPESRTPLPESRDPSPLPLPDAPHT